MLRYLEEKLALIEMLPGQTLVRFVLDPLAEFYAAFFFFEEGAKDAEGWDDFIALAKEPKRRQESAGFCRAIVNVGRSNPVFLSRIPERARAEIEATETNMRFSGGSNAL